MTLVTLKIQVHQNLTIIKVLPIMYLCLSLVKIWPLVQNADKAFTKSYMILVTKPNHFLRSSPMMCLCQFGENLAIGSEDRMQTRLFQSYMILVTKPNHFLRSSPMMCLCQFGENLAIGSDKNF